MLYEVITHRYAEMVRMGALGIRRRVHRPLAAAGEPGEAQDALGPLASLRDHPLRPAAALVLAGSGDCGHGTPGRSSRTATLPARL